MKELIPAGLSESGQYVVAYGEHAYAKISYGLDNEGGVISKVELWQRPLLVESDGSNDPLLSDVVYCKVSEVFSTIIGLA